MEVQPRGGEGQQTSQTGLGRPRMREASRSQAGWQAALETVSPTGTWLSAVPSPSRPEWILALRRGGVGGSRRARNVRARLESGHRSGPGDPAMPGPHSGCTRAWFWGS